MRKTIKLAALNALPVGGNFTSFIGKLWTVLEHGTCGSSFVRSETGFTAWISSRTVMEVTETESVQGDVVRRACTTWLPASAVRA